MKKLLLAGIVGVALISAASTVFAGDYHTGGTLYCAECHIMHGSAKHDNEGNEINVQVVPQHEFLLKASPNDLCLQCHDGQANIPDVLGANASQTAVRQAGALNKVGGIDGYAAWTGHTLESTDTPPGNSTTPLHGLECIDCHYQHARGGGLDGNDVAVTNAYRNLKAIGGRGISYTTDPADKTKDVYEAVATNFDPKHYDMTNISFNEPKSTQSGYAMWCQGCHTNYHANAGTITGTTGATEAWLMHPTAGSDIGGLSGGHSKAANYTGKTNKVQVLTSGDGKYTPSCMSCHKAHGNKNAFGLIWMSGNATATVTEEGDTEGTQTKALCKQCHSQG